MNSNKVINKGNEFRILGNDLIEWKRQYSNSNSFIESVEKAGKTDPELLELKNNLEICEVNLRNSLRERERNTETVHKLSIQIETIEKELKEEEIKEDKIIKDKINNLEKDIKDFNEKLDKAKQKLNESRIIKNKSI